MNKSPYIHELRNQLSVIKNTIKQMRGRAQYGTYEKFREHLAIIEEAVSKISDQIEDGHPYSEEERYKKILVPYDGSKFSRQALDEAVEISKKFGSILYLATVVDVSSVRPPGMLAGIMEDKKLRKLTTGFFKSLGSKTGKMLQHEMESCRKKGVETYYKVLAGSVASSILKYAKTHDIDLIVIGSKGLSGLGRIMALGSVSRKVSEEADCPVVIVR